MEPPCGFEHGTPGLRIQHRNTRANKICQPVTKTKTLNHENISTKITENISQNSPNIDPGKNNSKTHEAINQATIKISVQYHLISLAM